MKRLNQEQKMTIQFWAGFGIVIVGLVLLFLGFYAVPIGEIAPSVLTAFGEIATFAGALIGVDYRYRFKMYEERHRNKIREEDTEEEYDAEKPINEY